MAAVLSEGARAIVKDCTTTGFCLKELRSPSERLPLAIECYDRFSLTKTLSPCREDECKDC